MTEEDQQLLNDLKANVQQLFREFGQLEAEKKQLEQNIASLKVDIELLKQELETTIKDNEKWKIANRILSGSDENREAKQKINKLIRKIEKCIALLNM
jgi:regulator of replication initiation timing